MITVYADADPDVVHATLKALNETYPEYSDAAPVMAQWELGQAGTIPMDAPFHEGAIRYLEEMGMWSEGGPGVERRADRRDGGRSGAAWEELSASDMDDEAFRAAWAERRDAILAGEGGSEG